MNLHDLTLIGLTEKEAVVYDVLLRIGRMSAVELASKTDIPRTTIYVTTESLRSKNLVGTIEESGGTKFYAEHPERLLALCTDQYHRELHRLERAKVAVTEAERNYNDPIFRQTVVTSSEELLAIYAGLSQNTRIMYSITDIEKLSQWCTRAELKAHFADRLVGTIESRIITPHSKAAIEFSKLNYLALRETILIHGSYDYGGDLCVWGGAVSYFDFDTKRLTVMYAKDMAGLLIHLFELAWDRAQAVGLHFALPPDSDKKVYPVRK